MEAKKLIDKINNAKTIGEILDINNIKVEFAKIAKEIHPDLCSINGASQAMAKLSQLRDYFLNGKKSIDDAGEFYTNGYFVKFNGDKHLLKKSYDNWMLLKSIKQDSDLFHKYIPNKAIFNTDTLEFNLCRRGIPLSDIIHLEQKHVNWVLSRLFEFSSWLQQNGFVHAGLNMDSVFITPEDHGIQITSFYHMKSVDFKMDTISGKYKNWYPSELFINKRAKTVIDVELCKKIAISLLGDSSGSGVKLRKTHNPDFMSFVISRHDHANDAYLKYRDVLSKNFEKKFHLLEI